MLQLTIKLILFHYNTFYSNNKYYPSALGRIKSWSLIVHKIGLEAQSFSTAQISTSLQVGLEMPIYSSPHDLGLKPTTHPLKVKGPPHNFTSK